MVMYIIYVVYEHLYIQYTHVYTRVIYIDLAKVYMWHPIYTYTSTIHIRHHLHPQHRPLRARQRAVMWVEKRGGKGDELRMRRSRFESALGRISRIFETQF